jgi:hypothetical protein
MCSLKQSENPYLVHIDHFSDLDDESDELDELDEACAACGFEAGDCACGKDDDIDADTAGFLNPLHAVGYMVKGGLFPVVKMADSIREGANRMAGDRLVARAQERDSLVGANEDIRVASMVLDINRQGEGLKKLWSLWQKNTDDEKNVRAGGKGKSTSWFGYNWTFTNDDKKDFEHDFGILNTKTEVTIPNVKSNKLMTQLAHKMFSSSMFQKLMSIRKMTYRNAMNELYQKKSRFRDADDKHALELWYERDHGHIDDKIIAPGTHKAEHESVGATRKIWRQNKLVHDINEQHKKATVEHHTKWKLPNPFSNQNSLHSTHGSQRSNPHNSSNSLFSSHSSNASQHIAPTRVAQDRNASLGSHGW